MSQEWIIRMVREQGLIAWLTHPVNRYEPGPAFLYYLQVNPIHTVLKYNKYYDFIDR